MNIVNSVGHGPLSQLLNTTTEAGEQPGQRGSEFSAAMFQYKCVYKTDDGPCGPAG